MLEDRVRRVDGVAVREWGEDDWPTAVLWHAVGPLASGAYGRELAPALVARRWRLLAPDAPGYGLTAPRAPDAYELDTLADLLLALAGKRAALIGHSWGGAVALCAAAARPDSVSAVVLLDSGHFDFQDLEDVDPDATLEDLTEQSRARLVPVADWDELVREVRGEIRREPTETLLGIFREGAEQRDDGLWPKSPPEVRAAALLGLLRGRRMSALWPALGEAGVPVLLLTATEPPDSRAENDEGAARLLAAIPTAEWRPVGGAGHDLVADRGPEVGELVADWLATRP
ncbi:MAG: alpha/beta fold hydrolase [Gaiellaceae bacterium]